VPVALSLGYVSERLQESLDVIDLRVHVRTKGAHVLAGSAAAVPRSGKALATRRARPIKQERRLRNVFSSKRLKFIPAKVVHVSGHLHYLNFFPILCNKIRLLL
jgi:hypothetical protein